MTTPSELGNLLNGPALQPPPGVEPNFTNPHNSKTVIVAIEAICLALPTLAIFMRIYTQACITRKLVLEDYTISLAWALHIGVYVPYLLARPYTFVIHQWDVPVRDLSTLLRYLYVCVVVWNPIVMLIKVSIILQCLRIFAPFRLNFVMFWASHTLIWTISIFYFTVTCLQVFACKPVAKYWDTDIPGRCLNTISIGIATGIFNIVSDFMVLVLPQRIIWNLQGPFKKRLGVSAIFLTGVFACATTTLRLYYSVRLFQTNDAVYYVALEEIGGTVESSSGFLIMSLPVAPKFFKTLRETKAYARISSSLCSAVRSLKCGILWSSNEYSQSGRSNHTMDDVGGANRWVQTYRSLDGAHESSPSSRRASAV
ncbi:hypothetical protein MMC20_003834 [Loxospora ochrophaea]|nr:hypothetical protein [Loxospora ochrophaea]